MDATSQLLVSVARGDKEALSTLYQRQSARLFGIAMAILRERPAAADALQEGFVRVWLRARHFEPGRADADAWLAAVVRHAALDIARSRGREAPADDPGLGDAPVGPDALAALAAEQGARLRECLLRLEPKQRASIVLGFVHGLSHAEIAARLNEPPGTARSLVRRALISLGESVS